MSNKKKKERKIGVWEKEYRKMKRALERQRRAKRLIYELWILYSGVKD